MKIHTLFSDSKTGADLCLEQHDDKSCLVDLTLYRNRQDLTLHQLTPAQLIGIGVKMIQYASKHMADEALPKAYTEQVPNRKQQTLISRVLMSLIGKSETK